MVTSPFESVRILRRLDSSIICSSVMHLRISALLAEPAIQLKIVPTLSLGISVTPNAHLYKDDT